MEDRTEHPVADEPGLDEIIAELDQDPGDRLPERALRAAQRRREEITPRLIELIRNAAAAARAGEIPEGDAHLFALYLLTEFRAKEALPAILEAVSLPGEGPFDLFGDAITEDLGRILAALADDSPEILDRLMADRSLNDYVRWSAAGAYRCLVRDGRLTRAEAIRKLREPLRDAVMSRDADHDTFISGLVSELASYSPGEVFDEVEEAYRLELVDEFLIDLDWFRQCVAAGDAWFQRSLEHCRPTGIRDAVEELRSWAAFREAERPPALATEWRRDRLLDEMVEPVSPTIRHTGERVGRNDPCPCGSGKKYKKCCGAS